MINKKNEVRRTLTDHTRIIKELETSMKFHNWDYILSFLPEGSFLVGGYIRDIILGIGKAKIDVDIVVEANAVDIGKKIAENFNGKFIILDSEREVVRIIFNHISIDIAKQVSSNILEDLKSRDFSINSIAYSFDKKILIDPLNGIQDIEASILKTFSMKNLLDDPLRLLRCFRFVSEFNFNIDSDLMTQIQNYKRKLNLVAKERINYEIQLIVRGAYSIKSILLLNNFNILEINKHRNSFSIDIEQINYEAFNQSEKDEFLPLFFLTQILDEESFYFYKFSKNEINKAKLIKKWQKIISLKSIYELDEAERFELHKELESILPSFICYLPSELHLNWLTRWRDMNDTLFHPSNLIDGEFIKNQLNLNDGPLIGELLYYLSKELAYKRLNNFDEAIYKALRWIEQNAPKYD